MLSLKYFRKKIFSLTFLTRVDWWVPQAILVWPIECDYADSLHSCIIISFNCKTSTNRSLPASRPHRAFKIVPSETNFDVIFDYVTFLKSNFKHLLKYWSFWRFLSLQADFVCIREMSGFFSGYKYHNNDKCSQL